VEKKKREKLCPNCDGEMDIHVIVCPFCGYDMSLEEEKVFKTSSYSEPTMKRTFTEDPITSLYPPPYQPKVYTSQEESSDRAKEAVLGSEPPLAVEGNSAKFFMPIILFSVGVNLCFLALFMLIFSKDGELFLRWNSGLWILFLLGSLVMLFFGYRGLFKRS
jgi:hypothetical protein